MARFRVENKKLTDPEALDSQQARNQPHRPALVFRMELMTLPGTKLEHVRREFNSQADSLANMAMDTKRSTSEFECPADGEARAHGAAAAGQSFKEISGSKVVIEID